MAQERPLPGPLEAEAFLSKLPLVWEDTTLREQIVRWAVERNRVVVALDDDPTGTQTVHDVSVLTRWATDDLQCALSSGDPAVYVLTNTRSMPLVSAQALNRDVARHLVSAARDVGKSLTVVSRSDSTLRGHFPGEVTALAEAMTHADGRAFDGTCVIPFFPEGGRLTVGDVHWVREGHKLVPAAQTAYAQDAVFGYSRSDLPGWVEEKSNGRVRACDVVSISLQMLRLCGPDGAADVLRRAPTGSVIVVNAADYRDLEVFVVGLQAVEDEGRRYLFRTAASFVKVASGISDRGLLTSAEVVEVHGWGGGLIVVGSHVPKSTAQLRSLLAEGGVAAVELKVRRLLDPGTRTETIRDAAACINRAIGQGQDALVYTSREVVHGGSANEDLAIAESISSALAEVCRGIASRPRYVIGKGGITASDLATKAMGVRAARVLGQVLPGVPVWRLGPGSRWPGMPFVVFPGNVGDEGALADVVRRLRA